MNESTLDSIIGTKIGSYDVTKLIGAGAFGKVYKGMHPTIGRKVAIKVLSSSFSEEPETVHRFILEAKAANTINHPNIIQIFDFGELPDGRYYCIMDFVEGDELSTLIKKAGNLSLGESVEIISQIVDGLEAAHDSGIIHRDLKPDNIMVSTTKKGISVKILDFGIAKLQESKEAATYKTKTGQVMGTPAYMAPEQAKGDTLNITPQTDIYSLGVILYQMLSGELPLKGNSVADLLVKLILEEPAKLCSKVSGYPDVLCSVVDKSLNKDPELRYKSVREFLDAFIVESGKLPENTRGIPFYRLNSSSGQEYIEDEEQLSSAETIASESSLSAQLSNSGIEKVRSHSGTPPEKGEVQLDKTRNYKIKVFILLAILSLSSILIFVFFFKNSKHRTEAKPQSNDIAGSKQTKKTLRPVMRKVKTKKVIKPADTFSYKNMAIIKGANLCFSMGKNDKKENSVSPEHLVCLSPFAIDKTEVTVASYRKCVIAGRCTLPVEFDKNIEDLKTCNWGRAGGHDNPVNCVTWNQAVTFCKWKKKRLPTEAEWEYASRGQNKTFLYPWGKKDADCGRAIIMVGNNSGCNKGTTWPVKSRPEGISPFGLYDTIGNVWEWTSDFFSPSYYKEVSQSVINNPKGPQAGKAHTVRGGAFNTGSISSVFRIGIEPKKSMSNIGFRCAVSLSK